MQRKQQRALSQDDIGVPDDIEFANAEPSTVTRFDTVRAMKDDGQGTGLRGELGERPELLEEVYAEMRTVAARLLPRSAGGGSVSASSMVHEAWIRIRTSDGYGNLEHGDLLGLMTRVLRNVLIDRIRKRNAGTRLGGLNRVRLEDAELVTGVDDGTILAVDGALKKMEHIDLCGAKLIELRFFGGATMEQAAAQLGISRSTADKKWRLGRIWLASEISMDDS